MFEKENINTLDSKGEVLLSILSSLAQDESRSISENSTWGIRRRFEQGKLHVNHNKFLGYDKDEKGNLIVNLQQAKIVKRIYRDYLNGNGYKRIAKTLEQEKVPKWDGSFKWHESNIKQILTNEKYKGDALLQKTYTVDFLTKKRAVNDGAVPQYYVENSHPAIIDNDTWEAVQLEMMRRRDFAHKHGLDKVDHVSDKNPFSGRVVCGSCGNTNWKKSWYNGSSETYRPVWICKERNRVKGVRGCDNTHVDEKHFFQAFISTYNTMIENREALMEKWGSMAKDEDIWERVTARRLINHFKGAEPVTEFNSKLFYMTVEKLTVMGSNTLVVCLLDGTEIECEIE